MWLTEDTLQSLELDASKRHQVKPAHSRKVWSRLGRLIQASPSSRTIGETSWRQLHSMQNSNQPRVRRLARRIAFPMLFLGAGLMLVQPCASAPFQFGTTGSLITARLQQTATLLPNGKVLVAGGTDLFRSFASAELYDPAIGTWTATRSLVTARTN